MLVFGVAVELFRQRSSDAIGGYWRHFHDRCQYLGFTNSNLIDLRLFVDYWLLFLKCENDGFVAFLGLHLLQTQFKFLVLIHRHLILVFNQN